MVIEYIYLIQEREFIKTNENIYKIGKTKQYNNNRFRQYPKESILLHQTICNNCDETEKELIKIFKKKFKQVKNIGNEYFEGDYNDMIDEIYKTILHINDLTSKNSLKINNILISTKNNESIDDSINSYDDVWDTSHIDINEKYILLKNKTIFSTTLEFILKNEKNLIVLFNFSTEKAFLLKNNNFIVLNIDDIIKETMIKLHKLLIDFYKELIYHNILDLNLTYINNEFYDHLKNEKNNIKNDIYNIYCKNNNKTIDIFKKNVDIDTINIFMKKKNGY
jgi:hypothetical protein